MQQSTLQSPLMSFPNQSEKRNSVCSLSKLSEVAAAEFGFEESMPPQTGAGTASRKRSSLSMTSDSSNILAESVEMKKSDSASGTNVKPQITFIHRLYNMLYDDSISHLIWWDEHRETFHINASDEFTSVLAKYFKHSNEQSFIRQLNMYGFHKISDSSTDKKNPKSSKLWEFKHSQGQFKKGGWDALSSVRRRSTKNLNAQREVVNLKPVPFVTTIASAHSSSASNSPSGDSSSLPTPINDLSVSPTSESQSSYFAPRLLQPPPPLPAAPPAAPPAASPAAPPAVAPPAPPTAPQSAAQLYPNNVSAPMTPSASINVQPPLPGNWQHPQQQQQQQQQQRLPQTFLPAPPLQEPCRQQPRHSMDYTFRPSIPTLSSSLLNVNKLTIQSAPDDVFQLRQEVSRLKGKLCHLQNLQQQQSRDMMTLLDIVDDISSPTLSAERFKRIQLLKSTITNRNLQVEMYTISQSTPSSPQSQYHLSPRPRTTHGVIDQQQQQQQQIIRKRQDSSCSPLRKDSTWAATGAAQSQSQPQPQPRHYELQQPNLSRAHSLPLSARPYLQLSRTSSLNESKLRVGVMQNYHSNLVICRRGSSSNSSQSGFGTGMSTRLPSVFELDSNLVRFPPMSHPATESQPNLKKLKLS